MVCIQRRPCHVYKNRHSTTSLRTHVASGAGDFNTDYLSREYREALTEGDSARAERIMQAMLTRVEKGEDKDRLIDQSFVLVNECPEKAISPQGKFRRIHVTLIVHLLIIFKFSRTAMW